MHDERIREQIPPIRCSSATRKVTLSRAQLHPLGISSIHTYSAPGRRLQQSNRRMRKQFSISANSERKGKKTSALKYRSPKSRCRDVVACSGNMLVPWFIPCCAPSRPGRCEMRIHFCRLTPSRVSASAVAAAWGMQPVAQPAVVGDMLGIAKLVGGQRSCMAGPGHGQWVGEASKAPSGADEHVALRGNRR